VTERDNQQEEQRTGLEIAVIGIAGRFPGANSLATFWENLANGVDSIAHFTHEELLESGIDPLLLQKPNYVKAKGFVEDIEYFDAAFFRYSEREAEIMDPQIRILQECVWEALEGAGYIPQMYEGRIGLFAGASTNYHWMELSPLGQGAQGAEFTEAGTLCYKDSLSTLTAYKLGLKGPSITLYTACSTSLLAIHLASRALITGECDLALAGGVTISYPKKAGYLYEVGMTASPDGYTRPFDAHAGGSVFGDGVGVVLLKRLDEALQDGDYIHAIIKGSAANNDGARKVGYTAPSVEGQYEVITAALSLADVEPETISYVETHGTATPLGDTIEFEALKRAFATTKKSYCAIGSVKSNVGHLDTAAGVTGFIKTVLALQHRQIPPSLHFDHPNPKIGFVDSPFYVNTELAEWDAAPPRRAGVSSFGYGGTNVHVVLQEAPRQVTTPSERTHHTLTLSARTPHALANMTRNLAHFLQTNTDISLADVAYTLHTGRQQFFYRRAVVCASMEEALVGLAAAASETQLAENSTPGQAQHVLVRLSAKGMRNAGALRELYRQEPLVRADMERCLRFVETVFGAQVRRAISNPTDVSFAVQAANPIVTRFCLGFILEYTLTRSLLNLGVRPAAIVAQSLSHYTAACLAQVLSLEDALRWGFAHLQLAADPENQILKQRFAKLVRETRLQKPVFPLLSETTGAQITEEDAQNADYWLRLTEQFNQRESTARQALVEQQAALFLHIGEYEETPDGEMPRDTPPVIRLFAQEVEPALADAHFLHVCADVWSQGITLDWTKLYVNESRRRLPLPTYPFEKQRFWIDPPQRQAQRRDQQIEKRANIAEWFYTPTWQPEYAETGETSVPATWIFFQDGEHLGEQLATRLEAQGHTVITVHPALTFNKVSEHEYTIRPTQLDDYNRLLAEIARIQTSPLRILHLWTLGHAYAGDQLLELGFYSLISLAKALVQQDIRQELDITVLTNQLFKVTASDHVLPEKAPLLAPVKVIPQEHSHIKCRSIDIPLAEASTATALAALLREITLNITDTEVAYRRERRYIQKYEPVPAAHLQPTLDLPASAIVSPLRKEGVYLITGGLGGVGIKLASYLVRTLQAKIVLVSRAGLPPQKQWQNWLATHDQDDRTSFRIRQVQNLEASGGQVLVAAADVADEAHMRCVIQQAEDVFGKINGVIHAAGILRVHSAQCPIAAISQADCEEQFRSKMRGLNVLNKLLANYDLDFCLLVSSLSPILGGLGFAGYAAANLYMDAFVQQHSHDTTRRWIGVNWGDWQYSGPKFQKRMARTAIDALEMSTEEAIQTFRCILALENTPQIVVSSGDLFARIEQWIQLKPLRRASASQQTGTRAEQISRQYREHVQAMSQEQYEQSIVEVWQDFYRVQEVDRRTNFFELGATSLDIIQIHTKLVNLFQRHIPIEYMFENPTIAQLAAALSSEGAQPGKSMSSASPTATSTTSRDIAVIGMAGRFPGASSIDEFWHNLVNGVESIRFFTESELAEAGVRGEELHNPNYRRAKGYLEGTEFFDAAFFDYTPRDALLMDPQLRLFHECAWSAIEHAGYNITTYKGKVGVFAGASPNLYWQVLSILAESNEPAGLFLTSLLNDKDSLSTQISYKFDLNGPSVNVFSGCSTSLVAIDYACNALLSGQCDLALAGGITVTQPEKAGYMYQEGMLFSADGHCRAFDKTASGMVFGDGVGVVILKPLAQALADGDTIHAVIKGTAINNDGHRKIGYTAPSIDGQAEVIRAALTRANVTPESIGYLETHGTATQLGDVIEVAALKKVFGQTGQRRYPIGSVKTNVGHLNAASGVTGFIKAVLCLKHRLIPPSLYCETPNPQIDFADGQFYVNTTLQEWRDEHYPLRAGVSSFGIGGTNAHVVLEEPPPADRSSGERDWKVLLLSAKSQAALERMTDNLAEHFKVHPECDLADAAYTLQVGRQAFEHRRALVCRDLQEATEQLATRTAQVRTWQALATTPSVAFLFPGNGAQYINMARELYEKEKLFRSEMDTCFDLFSALQGIDLQSILYPRTGDQGAEAQARLDIRSMKYSQPIIFCVEYALAALLMNWGIRPSAMLGYSFGEYAAACLAGVFSLRDALQLIAVRGNLMGSLPEGAMVSVPLAEEQTIALLHDFKAISNGTAEATSTELAVAIDNGSSCIVAGSPQAISDFERFLRRKRLLSMRVASDVAAHSSHLEDAAAQFAEHLQSVSFQAPNIPFISGITGTWITDEQAQDANYWVRHMKETVRFASGVKQLVEKPDMLFLEVGPGRDLRVLAHRFLEHQTHRIQQTIRPEQHNGSDSQALFESLATLWGQGISIDWQAFSAHERRRRVPLPTYAFERTSYKRQGNPFELASHTLTQPEPDTEISKCPDLSRWFYVPRWRSTLPLSSAHDTEQQIWLVFGEDTGLISALTQELRERQHTVIAVQPGHTFTQPGEYTYLLDPGEKAQYHRLLNELRARQLLPEKILHCTGLAGAALQEKDLDTSLKEGFYSLLFLFQALARQPVGDTVDIRVITSGTQNVIGNEPMRPAHACLIGPGLVIAQELPYVRCSIIDLALSETEGLLSRQLRKHLLAECLADKTEHIVAYRGGKRWVCDYLTLELDRPTPQALPLKREGVYLITGAFGGIGKILARYLAKTHQAKLALVSRSSLPDREEWPYRSDHTKSSEHIRFVLELEALGSEVLVLSADCANQDRMAAVIAEVEQRFGMINGVIHAAGLVGDDTFKLLKDLDISDCEKQFQAKVRGVLVLQKLLSGKNLDFCLLMSSIATVLGGLGYAAYTAANLFMDAFVYQQARQSSLPWCVVDWSDWKYWNEGEKQGAVGQSVHKLSMEPEEGIDAFERVLACDERHLIHSPGNLEARIEQWINLQETQARKEPDHAQLHPRPELLNPYVAPRSTVEKTLADIWAATFRMEKIGIQDDFFELGGDSLKGITVVSRIHKELHVEVPVSELFQAPTIERLADCVRTAQRKEFEAIPIAPVKESYRLSSAQKRLYILHQMHPESTAYNDIMAYVLDGELDVVRFEEIFQQLIVRHESFRTSFELHNGEPVQKVHPSVPFTLAYQETTEEQARDFVKHFIAPFNLREAPLMRVALLKVGAERHILVLDIHHIITDGVSYDCLVRDFITLYQGGTLPALRLQYKDYAEWQHGEHARAVIARQEAYWLKHFAGPIPTLQLLTDYPRPDVQNFAGETIEFELGETYTEQVKKAALAHSSTVYTYLLSVFNILLAKYAGTDDLIVGSPVAGRSHPDLQGIIGMFVNMLPIRSAPAQEKRFVDYLLEVQKTVIEAFDNEQFQYDELITRLGLHGNITQNPLFNVVFVLQNMNTEQLNVGNLRVGKYSFTPNRAAFDLVLSAVEVNGSFLMTMEYATALFRRETITKMVERYLTILREVLANPQVKLQDIEIAYNVRLLEDSTHRIANEDFAF
jgi:acyl transferase domain-containing protein/aryl carrier-like protein